MKVEPRALTADEWGRATAVGIATGVLLAILNVVALKTHLSPLPQPLGLAFAETLFGRALPLPVGLLFHLAWVTFFSVVYVVLFRDALTLARAFLPAAALWLVALAVFCPIVGWGFFGVGVSPKVILPITLSHALFALLLWALCRVAFSGAAVEKVYDRPS
jgi:hypothetical protein